MDRGGPEREGSEGRRRSGPAATAARTEPRRITDRFISLSRTCSDLDELTALLVKAAETLGFRFVALVTHDVSAAGTPPRLQIGNYPGHWRRELALLLDGAPDPIQAASERTNCGFCWSEVLPSIALCAAQRAALDRAAGIGLGQGFTVPANIVGELGASCSFALPAGEPMPRHRLLCAETIGAHAVHAARRLSERVPRIRLSHRERQCLALVARGKTDWEIAHILGIGRETVRSYVKHARALYGVVSRTQLAIHGLRDAHISFADAIPPNG